MKKKEMTIAEIYEALKSSSIPSSSMMYSINGKRIFCFGCGRSARNATTLRHDKDCKRQLYWNTIYDLEKKVARSTDARLDKVLRGQKQRQKEKYENKS